MAGKILAAVLLFFGGGATLYIVYKVALGIMQPVVQKKLEQKMQKDNLNKLQNNLQLHNQQDTNKVQETQKKMKS